MSSSNIPEPVYVPSKMNSNAQVSPSHIEDTFSSKTGSFQICGHHFTTYQLCSPAIRLGQVLGLISWDLNLASISQTRSRVWIRIVVRLYKSALAILAFFVGAVRIKVFLEDKYDTTITMIAENSVNMCEIMFLFIVIVFCAFEEKRFYNLLQLLSHEDTQFTSIIQSGNLYFKYCVVQMILTIVTTCLHGIGTPTFDFRYMTGVTSYFFISFSSLFVAIFFNTIAYICAECFSAVHTELNSVLASELPISVKNLEQLRLRYEQIYQISASVQSTFSLMITADLMHLTTLLCLDLYFAFIREDLGYKTVSLVFVLLTHTYRVFSISDAADNLTNKAASGLEVLHNVRLKNLPYPEGFQIIVLLSNKLSQCPVSITAAGNLFRLNMNTFTTIMLTIFTYLIVLMQFRTPMLLDAANSTLSR